jgi:hypothetical protein
MLPANRPCAARSFRSRAGLWSLPTGGNWAGSPMSKSLLAGSEKTCSKRSASRSRSKAPLLLPIMLASSTTNKAPRSRLGGHGKCRAVIAFLATGAVDAAMDGAGGGTCVCAEHLGGAAGGRQQHHGSPLLGQGFHQGPPRGWSCRCPHSPSAPRWPGVSPWPTGGPMHGWRATGLGWVHGPAGPAASPPWLPSGVKIGPGAHPPALQAVPSGFNSSPRRPRRTPWAISGMPPSFGRLLAGHIACL